MPENPKNRNLPTNFLTRLYKIGKYWFFRLVRVPHTPHQTAMGLTVGVLAGYLPIIPLQMLLAVSLAVVVRGSKLAAAVGTWVTNPVTWIPAHMLYYYIGRAIVPFDVPHFSPAAIDVNVILDSSWRLYLTLVVGSTVMAVPSCLLSYILSLKVLTLYQARRSARRTGQASQAS